VQWGVNFELAKAIGLQNISILSPIKESLQKISVFVPKKYVEQVASAMHTAGAGTFSKYDMCSFRTEGIGTFRGMNNANPFIGTVGNTEKVDEVKIEMLCETWKSSGVVKAMLSAHPYEEVAFDIFPLANKNTEYGLGAVGEFDTKVSTTEFLKITSKKLNSKQLRFSNKKPVKSIKKVAVCGGSGGEFIDDAISAKADAFVTADIKYHTFQEYEEKILLIDAGHFETEHLVLPAIAKKSKEIVAAQKTKTKVFITKQNTNSIQYYTSLTM
jgi:hypothetical protein